jgi:hypothetical protein
MQKNWTTPETAAPTVNPIERISVISLYLQAAKAGTDSKDGETGGETHNSICSTMLGIFGIGRT